MTETSPLLSELKRLIQLSGPMPVWRYMETVPDPSRNYGYYVSRDPLGREGDFTTAPEVSQMFGELLGLWAASVWKAIGSPPLLRLIELGPGRGTMMADALRALRVLPPLYQSLSVHLVEINPVLREKQQVDACRGSRNISWHDGIDDIPDGPSQSSSPMNISTCCRSTRWSEARNRLARAHRRDSTADGKLVFRCRGRTDADPAFRGAAAAAGSRRPGRRGVRVAALTPRLMKIASRVRDQDGAALIIDYGHVRSDAGDTFQAIARHSFHRSPEKSGTGRRHGPCRFPGAGCAPPRISAPMCTGRCRKANSSNDWVSRPAR